MSLIFASYSLIVEEMGNISKWKESLSKRTASRQTTNLMQLVYGNSTLMKATSIDEEDSSGSSGEEESDGDDFFRPKGEGNKVCPSYCFIVFFFFGGDTVASMLLTSRHLSFSAFLVSMLMLFLYTYILCHSYPLYQLQKLREGLDDGNLNVEDCSKFTSYTNLKDWKEEKLIENIRDRFVTGDWTKAAQRNRSAGIHADDDDEVYGDFEDLETGEKRNGNETDKAAKAADRNEDDMAVEERRRNKLALRKKFDAEYPFS